MPESEAVSKKIYWIFVIALFGCFLGHGAFGFITKEVWLPYFALVGIGAEGAYRVMPWVGLHDISLAVSAILWPCRAVLLWMTFWCTWTALLRPLTGEGVWEFFERAGNYGVPLAFLAYSGWMSRSTGWFSRIKGQVLDRERVDQVVLVLRLTTGLLLIGHGGFGAFVQKQALVYHFTSVGIPLTASALILLGWFEIVLGLSVILKPLRPVVLFVFIWKIGSELLYPLSGDYVWEFIERFGSYGAALALFFLLGWRQKIRNG